jgi:hypothetical protein
MHVSTLPRQLRARVPLLAQNQNPPRAHRSFPPPAPPIPSSPRRRIKPENRTRRKLLNPNPRTYLDIRRRLTTALRVRPARERLRAIAKARARSFVSHHASHATIATIRVDRLIQLFHPRHTHPHTDRPAFRRARRQASKHPSRPSVETRSDAKSSRSTNRGFVRFTRPT